MSIESITWRLREATPEEIASHAREDLGAMLEVVDAATGLWWGREDLSRLVERVSTHVVFLLKM